MSHQPAPGLFGGRTAAHALDIIVVGCGLGGLSAAYALARGGHKVTIVESAPAIAEVGAGIQVSPNVSRVLESFGLSERLARDAVEPEGIVFRSYKTGQLVGRTDWTAMTKLYGAPYYHVHRADLHTMLMDVTLPLVSLRLSTWVKSYAGDGSILVSSNGAEETLKADLIVGADGVKSVLRGSVVGRADQAVPTGDAAYRAIVPASKLMEHPELREFVERPHMTGWMGPGRHVMGYCIRAKTEYNLVLLHPDDGSVESWTAEGSADKMRADFAGWEPRVEKLLSFVPSTLKWKLMDRQPLETWLHADGKLVLLGDSCHPMLPYRAQGAAMAIEDGAVLGALFARLQSPEQVLTLLKAYESLRHQRTAEVQASSRLNQHIFHLPDGADQEERDAQMRETLKGVDYGVGLPPRTAGAPPKDATAVAQDVLEHEGNPNQWADTRKSQTLFGYNAEKAAKEWLVEHGLETPAVFDETEVEVADVDEDDEDIEEELAKEAVVREVTNIVAPAEVVALQA
ncbi:FAD/NAD(P)-binding domain-containing protein [Exidia glandulosa HHB12029]|uniref:FAD/NAD(P)-binding domain-containing protein n=1 Tax=Exidia glandulosa HHB12029 TaxID=1314781 RepID=A0A166BK11_EXIGL|nr:FAD/NAD(P)-binding domain-containing protein [Exidia glandulosa HHB12029]